MVVTSIYYRWFMWRMESMALVTVTVTAFFCVAFKVPYIRYLTQIICIKISLNFRIMSPLLLLDWSWSMFFKLQLLSHL